MNTTMRNSRTSIAGLISASAASLCCISPVLALLGGAGGLASSFSWIEPLRPYLIGFTILIFAFAWYQNLRRQRQVDCVCEPGVKKSFLQNNTFLAVVTVFAALLITFPYYAKGFYPKAQTKQAVITSKTALRQAKFTIKGMTCEGCTEHVNSEIAKVNGVIAFRTSYNGASSIVKFDNGKTCIDSIAAAINKTGYKVGTQTAIND